jgi:Nucleotidyl transferase AbiEii toxin, Type IV TA system
VTTLESILRRIAADLAAEQFSFALIGGLAVSIRTEPRFTRDADLAVSVAADSDAEQLLYRLRTRGYQLEALVEQQAVGRLATARLSVSAERQSPVVDLLFASSGIEPELVSDAEWIQVLPQLTMQVARIGHLIALKVLAREDTTRPQDLIDLNALVRVASPDDIERARRGIGLITTRGYHRGRDLMSDLDALLRRHRP